MSPRGASTWTLVLGGLLLAACAVQTVRLLLLSDSPWQRARAARGAFEVLDIQHSQVIVPTRQPGDLQALEAELDDLRTELEALERRRAEFAPPQGPEPELSPDFAHTLAIWAERSGLRWVRGEFGRQPSQPGVRHSNSGSGESYESSREAGASSLHFAASPGTLLAPTGAAWILELEGSFQGLLRFCEQLAREDNPLPVWALRVEPRPVPPGARPWLRMRVELAPLAPRRAEPRPGDRVHDRAQVPGGPASRLIQALEAAQTAEVR